MVVSFAFDPAIASRASVEDTVKRQNLEAFLQGILENGLLIDAADERNFSELNSSVLKLAVETVKAQRVQILWTEIAKSKRRCVFFCPLTSSVTKERSDRWEELQLLAKTALADGIVLNETPASMVKSGLLRAEIIQLASYLDSRCEDRRRRFENPSKSFDGMTDAEREEVIGGAVRYASEIAFYDRMIGEGSGLPRFRKGIEYIVSIWRKHHVTRQRPLVVRIITKAGKGGKGIPGAGLEETASRINAIVCKPLSVATGVQVHLEIKRDSDDKFHARYLESASRAYQFDRGFDLFLEPAAPGNSSTQLMRNFCRRDSAAERHLCDICSLDTVYPVSNDER